MIYYILSDIHGNYDALSATIEEIDMDEPGHIICLGDIVGYGPDPNDCCMLVQKRCEIVVMGNHDYAALGKMDTSYFNVFAREAIAWTQDILTPKSRAFLSTLPFVVVREPATFVHSSPMEPEKWDYIFSYGTARLNFQRFNTQFCFVGHSHQPIVIVQEGSKIEVTLEPVVFGRNGARYITNVGSVGQPRDGDTRASYVKFNTDSLKMEYRRVQYNIARTQEKMRKAKIHQYLIERLTVGQ